MRQQWGVFGSFPGSPGLRPGALIRPGIDRIYGADENGVRLLTDAAPTILDSLIAWMAVL